jgi:mannose-6-phosphate isomerase-like protein (cupin superfamily)
MEKLPSFEPEELAMTITRREMCLLLPAAMLPVGLAQAAEAGEQGDSLASGGYAFETLTVHTTPSGAQTREALKGKLATGEALETHATTLAPGAMPHPPHHHVHSEMFLMREGTLELTVNGKTYRLGPGAVGFVRSNEEHGVKNVGTTPANYFVVEIGPGVA